MLSLIAGIMGATSPTIQARETEKQDPRSVPVKSLEEAIKSGRITKETVAAAKKDGLAPILIKLTLPEPFQPEGDLSNPQVEAQRQAIAKAQRAILERLDGHKFDDVKQYRAIPWMAMWADIATLEALVANPAVFRILPDRVSDLHLGTSVPQIGGNIVRQSLGNPGAGQTIAILDTGVDGNHPFLAGKVVSEACFSTSMPFSSSNLCPNGDSTAAGSGVPCNIAGANCGHGTHVAGIAAGNNGAQFGVAPQASIIAVQVFSDFRGTVRARNSDVLQGLERVYDLRNNFNIGAVNMSLGAGFYTNQATCDDDYEDIKDAIDNLRAAGIPTVASSGNNALPFQAGVAGPACVSSAIGVGATMGNGATEAIGIWPNNASQTGALLDLLAPGTNINSSEPGTAFGLRTGTSMAAPHVAGAFAVLRGIDSSQGVTAMFNALANTGIGITDSRGGQNITTPRIQLNAAVEAFSQRPLPATNLQVVSTSGTNIQVSWTDNSGVEAFYRLTATPPQGSLLPARDVTVGANQTSATVGTQTAADGTVLKLKPNTDYTLVVTACNGAGNCVDSQPLVQRTLNTLPAAPANLHATDVTSSSLTLRWSYWGSNPVTHFNLVRYFCGLNYDCNPVSSGIEIDGAERSFAISGLVGNWSTHWRLQACNDDGCSAWVDGPTISTPAPGTAPAAPTDLHLCGTGGMYELCRSGRITLIWDDNANSEDSYEFAWTIAQQGTPPLNGSWNTVTLGPNAQSYSFTSWNSGLIYYYRVRACNIYGCSAWSNIVMHTAP